MTRISEEKLQNDIKREAAKISTSTSGKIDKCEYLTEEKILPPGKGRIMEQVKHTYSPLGKVFKKQIKTTEIHGEKQIKAIEEHGKQLA